MLTSKENLDVAVKPLGSRLDDTSEVVAIEAEHVSRRFKTKVALKDVSIEVARGQITALLGPNGAGKTTLLRILSGLITPTTGKVWIMDRPASDFAYRSTRKLIGLVPSGERTFYMRISAIENLIFFSRLQGFSRKESLQRAHLRMEQVGLEGVKKVRVGEFSHGMQKRLSVARALLHDPLILLMDESTQGLDPKGAVLIKDLATAAAAHGAAVLWTTHRIDEIRGLAQTVTVLDHGETRFNGSVAELMANSRDRRYLIEMSEAAIEEERLAAASRELDGIGTLVRTASADGRHYLLSLTEGIPVGQAISVMTAAGMEVTALREEHSGIEDAFLRLTAES